jgi:hypothetical protein
MVIFIVGCHDERYLGAFVRDRRRGRECRMGPAEVLVFINLRARTDSQKGVARKKIEYSIFTGKDRKQNGR